MVTKDDGIWDVFISHASEDKAGLVEPLAVAIERSGFAVWYDRFTLKWGDSLRQSIERGLERSRYGIVVLSKAFFQKQWPQAELDGLFAKEASGGKVILPIWHGVSAQEVQERCPVVAGRLAISSDQGVDSIVAALCEVIGTPSRSRRGQRIDEIVTPESLPELESLAKNLWWLAKRQPGRTDVIAKLEEVFAELRDEIQQSEIVVPKMGDDIPKAEKRSVTRYDEFVAVGSAGRAKDVDFLMQALDSESDLATMKLVDFVLGLVRTREGEARIRHYLLKGSEKQRNYAALFFKRRGEVNILSEAVKLGCISKMQAFVK